jgi:hypothetical protein
MSLFAIFRTKQKFQQGRLNAALGSPSGRQSRQIRPDAPQILSNARCPVIAVSFEPPLV